MYFDGFPRLLDDELLYSGCAVYCKRAGYFTDQDALEDIFGARQLRISIDLPSHIAHLASAIPQPYGYSAEYLIFYHTLFPYYKVFANRENVAKAISTMLFSDMRGAHVYFGIC